MFYGFKKSDHQGRFFIGIYPYCSYSMVGTIEAMAFW